jgi:hypothetical protein
MKTLVIPMAGIDIDNWFDYQVAVNTYKSISK